MLGNNRREQGNKTYLNIKNGKVVQRTQQGERSYDYVDGVLASICTRERVFRGETVLYWYVDLWDEESRERYSLGFPYASNTFKSIILQMASEDGVQAIKRGSVVRIEPYSKNGYDKVQVWSEGVRLNWIIKKLPPVEEKSVGGKKVKDDSKRMELINSLATKVREAIPNPYQD